MRIIFISFFVLVGALGFSDLSAQPLQLWYDAPATQWEEAIPLGNGRLGMMPDGGIHQEDIVLNDITLWSGSEQDANNYDAYKALPSIRQLLMEGKNDEAYAHINKNFICKGQGSGHGNGANVPFGCYQVLGTLHLQYLHGKSDSVSTYRRSLSLNDAIATTSYVVNNVRYEREYFTSFSSDVSIVKLTASKRNQLSIAYTLSRPERSTIYFDDGDLIMEGQLNNGVDGRGMKYQTRVRAKIKDGVVEERNGEVSIKEATEVILYISSTTDFKRLEYLLDVNTMLEKSFISDYREEKRSHIQQYQKLFDRVKIQLAKEVVNIPTNKRLQAYYKFPERDVNFPILFYQYGRYLLISSVREGLLPPNLQGLWANQIQTPWNGDYHLDVNIQMNHWPIEVSNLSELNLPLAEWVKQLSKNGERTAKAYYDAEGWVAHVISNVWGFTEPGEEASWGASNAGAGWLCNNLWEHYAFTLDETYLRDIYPVLKGAAKFYKSVLMKDPKTGWLVTGPSISPENSFYLPNGKATSICLGPTIDNQLTRELFQNVIEASSKLQVDNEFINELKRILPSLPPAGRVGSDGRLMEWLEEYKETDPQHRHISHLYGLFPGNLISPTKTPELIDACKRTLEVRGDDSPGWSKAYKLLFWARLYDGNRAYTLLHELLKPTSDTQINYGAGGGTYANLFSAGPPFQIDGNFGGTAGIAEMLLQSHEGFIHLLPSIPDVWKNEGNVKGFKARGGYTVDFYWKNGTVRKLKIYGSVGKTVSVKMNGKMKEVKVIQTK